MIYFDTDGFQYEIAQIYFNAKGEVREIILNAVNLNDGVGTISVPDTVTLAAIFTPAF